MPDLAGLKHKTLYGAGPTKIGAVQWDDVHSVASVSALLTSLGLGTGDAPQFAGLVLSAGGPYVVLNNTTGAAIQQVGREAGVSRWSIDMPRADGLFCINRYDDTGVTATPVMSISRATGVITLGQPLPEASGGTGDTGTAWTSTSGAVTATSGTGFTATSTIRYKIIGKTAFFTVTASVSANGTGAGAVNIIMPFTAGAGAYIVSGRENAVSGSAIHGIISSGGSTMVVRTYSNGYPAATGASMILTGVVETA